MNEGDHIRVSHPKEGEWKVEKLNKTEVETPQPGTEEKSVWDE